MERGALSSSVAMATTAVYYHVFTKRQVYSAHKEHGETNMENRLNVTTMHPSELLNHIHKFNMSNSFYLSLSASMFVISASHSLHAGEVM